MTKYFTLQAPGGTIDITYMRRGSVNVHFTPESQPEKGYEMICAHANGTIYDEEGPSDRARILRSCLPELQDAKLPVRVKKALSGIRLYSKRFYRTFS